jgi:predicted GNAT family acetyltransferase
MAGERLCTPTHREISAVCTHPEHTGHGYAAGLMEAVRHQQLARGTKSILHVVASNTRAISLYERLGFETAGEVLFQRFKRA